MMSYNRGRVGVRVSLLIAALPLLVLSTGCLSGGKHYRDDSGILKTETREASGIRK